MLLQDCSSGHVVACCVDGRVTRSFRIFGSRLCQRRRCSLHDGVFTVHVHVHCQNKCRQLVALIITSMPAAANDDALRQ